jgi:energy-coupling factor transport system substrate-specific component
MRSDRIYRKGLSLDVIRDQLVKGRGTQFDPDFLDGFLVLADGGKLDEIAAREPLLVS